MKLWLAGSGLVITRSSTTTGRPFDPLFAVPSVAVPSRTTVSRPRSPAMQPPTGTLVLAAVMASTSEHPAPVSIRAASAGVQNSASAAQAVGKARTTE